MDWYDEIKINDNLKITFLPAVHWSKRSLTDTNKSLWGNFLIEYNGKKILFTCDTGIGDIYKDIPSQRSFLQTFCFGADDDYCVR